MSRARLWLHADDAGMTPSVTDSIALAWRAGLLDGFSVLGNGTALDRLTGHLRADPERPARLAAHLNLHEGLPIAGAGGVPLLVDGAGHLRNGFVGLLARWLTSGAAARRELLAQIELEWRAQLARVTAAVAPRPLTALDSHVHLHMLPFLFPLAARLAREHDVPQVRVAAEPAHLAAGSDLLRPSLWVNAIKHVVLRICARSAVSHSRREQRTHPDALVGVLYSGRMTAAAALAACEGAEGEVEVLFHVGRATEAEGDPWAHHAAAFAFQRDPARDAEREELARLREALRG